MRCTFFIADLHLSENRPDITASFCHFMQHTALKGEALYILGDLFDFWIGDDEDSPFIRQVKAQFHQLVANKIPCFLIKGNRDFLIGESFAKECGLTLLPDYHTLNLYNTPTLLCHGDTLCIDDLSYQAFRQKVQKKWRQRLFLALPLSLRLKIAHKIRQQSQNDKTKKSEVAMDVNADFVTKIMATYQATCLIHGHTHKEAIHFLANNQQRIVLGDWGRKENPVSILQVFENGKSLFLHQ